MRVLLTGLVSMFEDADVCATGTFIVNQQWVRYLSTDMINHSFGHDTYYSGLALTRENYVTQRNHVILGGSNI